MRSARCLIPAAVLLLCCAAPLYFDRAEVRDGLSVGLGAGVATGEWRSGEAQSTHMPEFDYCNALVGSVYLQYKTPDQPFALFFRGYGGPGKWLTGNSVSGAGLFDVQGGAKFRLGDAAAFRVGLGLPSLIDGVFLLDLGRFATTSIGAGFRGFSLSLAFHPRLSRRLVGYVSLNGLLTPWSPNGKNPPYAGAAGLGLEVVDWSNIGAGGTALLRLPAQIVGFSAGSALSVALAGMPGVLAAPAVGAGATWLVGNWCYRPKARGSLWWAVVGSYGGALVGGGLGGLVALATGSQAPIFVGVAALAPTGALVAYHMSRPKDAGVGLLDGRLELPSLAVRQEWLPDRSSVTVHDARLVTVRF